MSYKVFAGDIQVRGFQDKDKPRYIVNGTAVLANKKHIYDKVRNPDGSIKTLKNMFTPHCIQSIKEQSKHKGIFVDVKHELVRNASIKEIAKGKLTDEEFQRIDNMLKRKMLPLAKVNDFEVEGDKLNVFTELNPLFREVDDDHKNYFD